MDDGRDGLAGMMGHPALSHHARSRVAGVSRLAVCMYEVSSGAKRKDLSIQRSPPLRGLFEQRHVLGEVKKFVAKPSNQADGHEERMRKYQLLAEKELPLFYER
jgi:hypothetical protein